MRVIKFRGKRVDNGEWVYGSFLYFKGEIIKAFSIISIDAIHHKVHPETVGQFTGLKDKNGVDIYGGDELKYQHVSSNEMRRGCVEYSSFDVRFEINRTTFHLIYLSNMEVTGNIHDLKQHHDTHS